jgi:hypothetical protein
MPGFTGLSWATNAKYLGRIGRYWAWMTRRIFVGANVFADLRLEKPPTEHGEQERAFTDTEVQCLLMGTEDVGMRDVMMVAALTGARLDAVIDLRIGDSVDGWFTFKPQKKDVPRRDLDVALLDRSPTVGCSRVTRELGPRHRLNSLTSGQPDLACGAPRPARRGRSSRGRQRVTS